MAIVDKRGYLSRLNDATLELGCGPHKRHPEAVAIDALDYDCVDIVGDIFEVLSRIPDHQIMAVHSYHFFEHITDLPLLLKELGRVLKPNGRLGIAVPHFSNPYHYSDYTHRQFFGLYSFSYLSDDFILRRRVPSYNQAADFRLERVDLIFKSSPPFYGRHSWKKLLQFVFNLNGYMRELYEENFCYLFPCYEVRFELTRKELC
jgi:predicted SAM-dependent methyltransferase